MRSRRPCLSILLLGLACLTASCGPSTRATTARDFIENYADAMLRKSASRVLAMEADGPLLLRFALDEAQRKKLARFDPDVRRAELERLFKNEDIWWKAWCVTRYKGDRIHGNHLDVDVTINAACSQVILVRAEDGTLRLHPLPGWLHADRNRPATEDEPPAGQEFEEGAAEE